MNQIIRSLSAYSGINFQQMSFDIIFITGHYCCIPTLFLFFLFSFSFCYDLWEEENRARVAIFLGGLGCLNLSGML